MSEHRDACTVDLALSVPLDGIRQIEASAGTGKTYTIAGLYVRLIVERGLSVRQILVMTFTKAATEELRRRLRERLALCARLADADPQSGTATVGSETEWAQALLQRAVAAGEARDALARRLRMAALGMDEAAIFTIHGFCQRVLTEHAALLPSHVAGAQLAPSDIDLLEDFAADAWLRSAQGDSIEREALVELAATPGELARLLASLVNFGGAIEPVPPAPEPGEGGDIGAARATVIERWRREGDEALSLFATHAEAGHFNKRSYPADSPSRLGQLAEAMAAGDWPDAGELSRFAAGRIAAAVKKDAPAFPGHAAFDAIQDWVDAEAGRASRRRARLPALLHALVDKARDWLRGRKRMLARLSYDDQISRVHDGLQAGGHGKALLAALRAQYPVALVDEFQDTDARQFDIFARLYGDFGTLFCIGDPKQAIYGFRGGDVHAYLRARSMAEDCYRLQRNFRSSPGVLAACEALFSARDDVFVEPGIRFEHVDWGGRAQEGALHVDGAPVVPMTLWQLPEPPAAGGKDASRDLLARGCAGEIARMLQPGVATLGGEPLQPHHIAVLVNTNAEAGDMQDALASLGVAAVCVRHESVYASAEALELRRLLDALLAPQDMMLARAALATTLLGHSLADLRAMHDDEARWRVALNELAELRERWFGRGVQAMLERLGERHAARLLVLPDGERRMSNLLQLGDALQAQARQLAGERAQRDWLAQRMHEADSRNEEEQLRLESDAARVQIVTVHASKGLEYDLVFMPFAALMQTRAPKAGEFVRFHRGDALVQRYILSDSKQRNADDQAAIEAAVSEDLAEGVRRLYVGVTRARHACWLSVGRPSARASGGVLDWVLEGDRSAIAAVERGKGSIAAGPVPEPGSVRLPRPVTAGLVPARRFERRIDRHWWIHSFSRLAEGERDEEPVAGASDEGRVPELPDAGGGAVEVPAHPRGPLFGKAVHDALESVDFAAWAGGVEAAPAAQRVLVSDALAANGLASEAGDASVEATERMLAAALSTPVLPGLALAQLPPSSRRAEMEFHFGIAGADPGALLALLQQHGYQLHRRDFARAGTRLAGLMTGFIDLVFVHEGRWWIVDYKTNHLGDRLADYAPERLPAAMAHHDYDLQYLIYTVALHRWLGLMRGDAYDYDRDVGGALYLFLRGMGRGDTGNGIFRDRPPRALIEGMDALLAAPGECS